jgi:hypothetical protein
MYYTSWRARAAAELMRLYGVDADSIPEEVWKQLYVLNYTVREAVARAERVWRRMGL